MPIPVSFFSSVRSVKPERGELRAADLLTHDRRDSKEGRLWSPALYPPGETRSKAGVVEVSALAFDLDGVEDAAVEKLVDSASGLRWILHSTHSHRSEAKGGRGCYRAVFALSRRVAIGEWPRFWRAAVDVLGLEGVADPACADASRIYFLPSAPRGEGVELVALELEGEPLDVDAVLELAPVEPARPGRGKLAGLEGAGGRRGGGRGEPPSRPGGRNARLASEAGRLRRAGISLEGLEGELLRLNREVCDPPLDDDEVRGIARSIATYEPAPNAYRLTEEGNAQRLVDRHGEHFRRIYEWGKWCVFDGRRWATADADTAMLRFALKVVQELWIESAALAERDPKLSKAVATHARASSKAAALRAMVAIAAAKPNVSISFEAFDADPMLLNCRNGTLDLRTGELRPHAREDFLSRLAGAPWDVDALDGDEGAAWEKFVLEISADDAELAEYLRRVAGYCATGDVSEHALFFLYGLGANGKNTFVDAVSAALGDYAKPGAPNLLIGTTTGSERHPTEIADLYQARLVSCEEVDEGRAWAEATVKLLTGGGAVKARRMHEDFWAFAPTHKFVVSGNHKPRVRETTEGIWRRLRLIPFEASFRGREDPTLGARLRSPASLSAILAWLVAGCLDWQREGLREPRRVVEATSEYRTEQDEVGLFVRERCEVGGGRERRVAKSRLYREYTQACAVEGQRFPMSAKRFVQKIAEMGFAEERDRAGERVWVGIALKSEITKSLN